MVDHTAPRFCQSHCSAVLPRFSRWKQHFGYQNSGGFCASGVPLRSQRIITTTVCHITRRPWISLDHSLALGNSQRPADVTVSPVSAAECHTCFLGEKTEGLKILQLQTCAGSRSLLLFCLCPLPAQQLEHQNLYCRGIRREVWPTEARLRLSM